jgi:Holliday junction resolvase RusA-like endonuclease
MINVFIPEIPKGTAQQKGLQIVEGRPHYYTKPNVKAAKDIYASYLRAYRPAVPIDGAIALHVAFYYKPKTKREAGTPKKTRPDVDNLVKMIADILTDLRFWHDDAQVTEAHIYKNFAKTPEEAGVMIMIKPLEVITCN